MQRLFLFVACILVLGAAVCSAAPHQPAPANSPAQPIWINVPYVHQPPDGCGAASLSMVMLYWASQLGRPVPPASDVALIQQQLYDPAAHGILASSMQSYLREHGYLVFALRGHWSDLETQLHKGRPLIVALRPQGQRALHYVVVDGIDSARGLVTMNDPQLRKLLSQERASFEKEWSATGSWMLLAVPAPTSH